MTLEPDEHAIKKERWRIAKAKWRKKHPEKAREANLRQNRRYRKNNPEANRKSSKAWSAANPDYLRNRRKNNPQLRMIHSLQTRLSRIVSKGRFSTRPGSMIRDMGCDREFLLRHITSQFTAGMTMENYGKVWHLDHIYPLSKADLTDRVQFLAAANWRNLRPMLGPENLEKSDTITPEGRDLFDHLCREFSQERGVA